jgi:CO dehydrogenase nickel-insertion accessory protein CooC1
MNCKIAAVWGSPGCGKTVVAAKLARRLVEQGRSTILLFCDTLAPPLPCVIASSELEREHSLGSVFAAAHISESLVRNNLISLKRTDKLSLLGFLKGENSQNYPQCSECQAIELLECLREIAEYVVIDCTSGFDTLTLAALKSADTTLRLVNGELKSLSYYASKLQQLAEKVPNIDANLRVAANTRPLCLTECVSQLLSKSDFALPYSTEIERQCADGNLLSQMTSKDGKMFNREIDKMIDKINKN